MEIDTDRYYDGGQEDEFVEEEVTDADDRRIDEARDAEFDDA